MALKASRSIFTSQPVIGKVGNTGVTGGMSRIDIIRIRRNSNILSIIIGYNISNTHRSDK